MKKVFSFMLVALALSGCKADGLIPSPTNSNTDTNNNPAPSPSPSSSSNSVGMSADWTPQWNSVVAYWDLSSGSGSIANGANISSSVGLPGIANNQSGTGMAYVPLQIGNAISLNGVDNYIDINTTANLPSGTAPRTMCGWGNLASTSGGYSWIGSFGSPNLDQAMFIGNLGDSLVGGGYDQDDVVAAHFWQPNTWHHVCLTYDGTYASLYGDGVLVSGPTAKSWNLVKDVAYLGKQVNNYEYWNGMIAQVAIWNAALSAQDVQTIYARQAPAF